MNSPADNFQPGEILCACENATIDDLRTLVHVQRGITFEQMLERTRYGGRCTACLLDLEHYFVRFAEQAASSQAPASVALSPAAAAHLPRQPRLPLKQRIYRVVDRMAPQVPMVRRNVVPVLLGPGIRQQLIIANQSLMFEGEFTAPDMRIDISVHDSFGQLILEQRKTVTHRSTLRVDLTEPFERSGPVDSLGVGSVTVTMRALSEGYRGTTRPQIEILTDGAACAVHGQAVGRNQGGSIIFGGRDTDERRFISLVSRDRSTLPFELRYPLALHGSYDHGAIHQRLSLPPNGACLVELEPCSQTALRSSSGLLRASWKSDGQFAAHVLIADRQLGRFSIDHS
jgi:hypothetical protein